MSEHRIGEHGASGRVAWNACKCGRAKGIHSALCKECSINLRLAPSSEALEGLDRTLQKRLRQARPKERFQLFSVTGHEIRPGSGRAGGNSAATTTWAVLDQIECWQEVAVFQPGNGVGSEACRQKAAALARELNAAESEEAAE